MRRREVILLGALLLVASTAQAAVKIRSTAQKELGDVHTIVGNWTKQDEVTAILPASSVPGGLNTHVQYNDGGVFGGDANFRWKKTTRALEIGNNAQFCAAISPLDICIADLGASAKPVGIYISNPGTANGNYATLNLVEGNGTKWLTMRHIATSSANTSFFSKPLSDILATGSLDTGGLTLMTTHIDSPIVFATGGGAGAVFTSERMRITGPGFYGWPLGGQVGIGMTAPVALLDLKAPTGTGLTTGLTNITFRSGTQAISVLAAQTISLIRQNQFLAPTITGIAGGSTERVTDSATLYIDGPAIQGADITFTNRPLALHVGSGVSQIDGALRLTPQASPPASMVAGDMYVDTTGNELCFYDGAAWQGISTGTDGNCA